MTAKLQIYKDSLELVKILYRAMPEMPRKDRFQIGADVMERSYELLDYIVLANRTRVKTERLKHLDNFYNSFVRLKTLLLLCRDFRLLKDVTLARADILIVKISAQLNGWRQSTSRM